MHRSLKNEEKLTILLGQYIAEQRPPKHGRPRWKVRGIGEAQGQQFTLHQENPFRWQVSGINSSGSLTRVRFNAKNPNEAVEAGAAVLFPLRLPAALQDPEYDLADAIHRAVMACAAGADYKKELIRYGSYFLDWWSTSGHQISAMTFAPEDVCKWSVLRPLDFRNYLAYLEDPEGRPVGVTTRIHYMEPLRKTSAYMAENWPDLYRHVTSTIEIHRDRSWDGLYREDEGNPWLSFEQLLDFIEFLKDYEHAAILIPGVLLQGLQAMQLLEALRLRWDTDVDLQEGTITVQSHERTETRPQDKPKNKYRVRRLPLVEMVRDYLRQMPHTSETVVPYPTNHNSYGLLLKRALLAWKSDCDIAPKDLRNTVSTHAQDNEKEERWNLSLVARFMGHAPQGIREKHYYGDKKGRLVPLFERRIVDRIDAVIERIKDKMHGKCTITADTGETESKSTAKIIDIA